MGKKQINWDKRFFQFDRFRKSKDGQAVNREKGDLTQVNEQSSDLNCCSRRSRTAQCLGMASPSTMEVATVEPGFEKGSSGVRAWVGRGGILLVVALVLLVSFGVEIKHTCRMRKCPCSDS
jgi:hypothetical protein